MPCEWQNLINLIDHWQSLAAGLIGLGAAIIAVTLTRQSESGL